MLDISELNKEVMKKIEPIMYNFDNIEVKIRGKNKIALTYDRNGFSHLSVFDIKAGSSHTLENIAEILTLPMFGAWDAA